MRRPYSIPCRFLRNSDLVGTVKWVEAQPDALTLDRTNIISSQDWELDRGLLPVAVGEQEGRRVFRAAVVPVGLGRDHVCGTDEEFDQGGLYEPDLPPVVYGAAGFPLCCLPPRRLRGGGAGSGRSDVSILKRANYGGAGASARSPVTPGHAITLRGGAGGGGRSALTPPHTITLRGGAGGGGRAALTPPHAITLRGGAGGGGRADVRLVPVCQAMGYSCLTAAPDDLEHWCYWMVDYKLNKWRRWPVVAGETYQFTLEVFHNGGHAWSLSSGESCELMTQLVAGDFHNPFQQFTFTALGSFVWYRTGSGGPTILTDGVTRLAAVT
jgi:hypothetical protein